AGTPNWKAGASMRYPGPMNRMIYHMSPAETWQEAVQAGIYRGTADDLRDGFIHFSTAEQIAESARRHRPGQTGLLLTAIESARLGDGLKMGEITRRRAVPAPLWCARSGRSRERAPAAARPRRRARLPAARPLT